MFSTKNLAIKKALKIASLVSVGLCLGMVSMLLYKKQQSPRRSVASIQTYKPAHLVLGKHAAAMSVEVVGPESYPDNPEELVELVGYITQNIQGDSWLDYKWALPAGVDLVQGQITGSLNNSRLGEYQQVSILVKGFSRENQKLISLSTHIDKAGAPLTASSVVVSRPEETVEAKVMETSARIRAAQAEARDK
jgi:hypothetical protein